MMLRRLTVVRDLCFDSETPKDALVGASRALSAWAAAGNVAEAVVDSLRGRAGMDKKNINVSLLD